MKKLNLIIAIFATLAIVSCQQDDDVLGPEVDLESEETVESAFEDIDVITQAGMDEVDINSRRDRDLILECAVVDHDTATNTIVIDYGEGCEGPGGRIRKGKVIINYQGRRFEPGSFRIVTLENFFLDSVQIEGTRTVTNISESLEDNPTFSVKLEGGKATFTDGTFTTREAEHERTWYRAENPLNDSTTVDGEAFGVTRRGNDYSVAITETLIWKRSCNRVHIPVAGEKVYTVGDEEVIVNYGDGECDNIVTVTADGETIERALRLRGRL